MVLHACSTSAGTLPRAEERFIAASLPRSVDKGKVKSIVLDKEMGDAKSDAAITSKSFDPKTHQYTTWPQ